MKKADSGSNYVIGKAYFRLTYHDMDLIYPKIDTVIYLGKGSELKEKYGDEYKGDDLLFFQDAASYAKHGFLNSQSPRSSEETSIVRAVESRNAKISIFDAQRVADELADCERRANFSIKNDTTK